MSKIAIIRAKDIIPQATSWLWPGWLAKGKLHLLGGPVGSGKTGVALKLSATITAGGVFPDGSQAPTSSVLMWSGEDTYGDTIYPRFLANGGDAERFHLLNNGMDDAAHAFDPATDFPDLIEAAKAIPDLALIVIDPIVSAVTGDTHKNAEVRRALQPLVNFCNGTGIAILGITHLSKGTAQRDPVGQITGSVAFGAVPRMIWMTTKPRKAGDCCRLVRAKSNISETGGGFEYTIGTAPCHNQSGPPLHAAAIKWGDYLTGAPDELLSQDAEGVPHAGPRAQAAEWLEKDLAAGPLAKVEIDHRAALKGFSAATVRRAQKDFGIEAYKEGAAWFWRLPESEAPTRLGGREDAHAQSQAELNTLNEDHRDQNDDAGTLIMFPAQQRDAAPAPWDDDQDAQAAQGMQVSVLSAFKDPRFWDDL